MTMLKTVSSKINDFSYRCENYGYSLLNLIPALILMTFNVILVWIMMGPTVANTATRLGYLATYFAINLIAVALYQFLKQIIVFRHEGKETKLFKLGIEFLSLTPVAFLAIGFVIGSGIANWTILGLNIIFIIFEPLAQLVFIAYRKRLMKSSWK